ncbi:very short patch repair endonuclease [Cyclobacterium xiamenense]|uniref:very short patch repair endonuclease n=1 Tax=Cyclobacterium xiamenense TaxID=1297121 RepID=UPI0012B9BE36|nr:DNA mismatch endonuclease Vsr [Cyclobacterium xiamenense]
MADVHEPEVRSYNMSRIKGKDTKPEMLVRKFLHARGFRYKLHDKKLPGKPDIVLPKYNTIVQVHGCFWHGHEGCNYYVVPKTRTQWWLDKITTNKRKDRENENKLIDIGWNVLTVFECELKSGNRQQTLMRLIKRITNGDSSN